MGKRSRVALAERVAPSAEPMAPLAESRVSVAEAPLKRRVTENASPLQPIHCVEANSLRGQGAVPMGGTTCRLLDCDACEKMGTDTSARGEFRGFAHRAAEPVPIFSQARTSGLSNLTLLIRYILVFSRADGPFVPSAIQGCSHEEGVRCSFDGDGAAGT